MTTLFNKTLKKKICSRVVFRKTALSKALGLMFRTKKSVEDCAWLFVFDYDGIISLTMWFVFFPIDVIFLDKNFRIVEMKENFKPWTFCTSRKECRYFVELASGFIKENRLKIGQKLEIRP